MRVAAAQIHRPSIGFVPGRFSLGAAGDMYPTYVPEHGFQTVEYLGSNIANIQTELERDMASDTSAFGESLLRNGLAMKPDDCEGNYQRNLVAPYCGSFPNACLGFDTSAIARRLCAYYRTWYNENLKIQRQLQDAGSIAPQPNLPPPPADYKFSGVYTSGPGWVEQQAQSSPPPSPPPATGGGSTGGGSTGGGTTGGAGKETGNGTDKETGNGTDKETTPGLDLSGAVAWLTAEMFAGIPNWTVLAAVGLGLYFFAGRQR